MQAAQLYDDEKQEEYSGQAGVQQVLSLLPEAHPASRDEVVRERIAA
jgi:hypothetical protein